MNAAAIAEKLAGHPVKSKGANYLVCCPAHDDADPSLSLCDGDDGKLLVNCFAGCNPLEVLAAIRAKIGNTGEPEAAPKPAKGSSEYERDQREKAAWLWSRRRPITGTIAEKYLREQRGIACRLPATLGFLPPLKREHHPAMISAFGICEEPEPGSIAAPRDVVAVHLTLLKPDGSGKAEVEKPKLVIASPRGLPITIAPPNDLLGLAITEGLEDALSIHAATGLGAWVAGSAPMMPALADAVPDCCNCVTIVADANEAGQSNSTKLLERLAARGIHADIVPSEATP